MHAVTPEGQGQMGKRGRKRYAMFVSGFVHRHLGRMKGEQKYDIEVSG